MFILIKKELSDSLRNKWLTSYAVMYMLIALGLSYFSLLGISGLGLKALGRITASLINLTIFLTPLASLMLGSTSIVSEREAGSLEWLLSQPVSRRSVILGKFLGLTLAISIATALGYGFAGLFLSMQLPSEDLPKYLGLILISSALAAVGVAIGIFVSITSRGRFEALATSLLLWLTWVIIYDLLVMGASIAFGLTYLTIFFLLVLNPVESSRLLMAYIIDPTLSFLGLTGMLAARDIWNLPLFLASVIFVWCLLPLIASFKLFAKKDL